MSSTNPRNVCVVVTSRANYARVKTVLRHLVAYESTHLQLIVSASALLARFGTPIDVIRSDGFEIERELFCILEGDTLETQAKSTAMGILELSTAFSQLKPDVVVTVADRFETMATAISASYMNIPLAHIQGGEVSGNIDDRVRHAITKLSDLHFPSTKQSRERLIKMGEDPQSIFNFGCPAMDLLLDHDLGIGNAKMTAKMGIGPPTDWSKPYILMVQHPVTCSFGEGRCQVIETLEALKGLKIQKIVLWPNVDAGSDHVSKGIRVFRENNSTESFHYYKNFTPEDYAAILNNASVLVGNSSSFIREGSFLGVPAVIVGDRQENREHGSNVQFSPYGKAPVREAVLSQLEHGRYEPEPLFGHGNAGQRIAETLATVPLTNKKSVMY